MKITRDIFVAHTSGQVKYKGEARANFKNMSNVEGGFRVREYEGGSGTAVWPDFVEAVPDPVHRTRLRPGEVLALLKDPSSPAKGSYAKIYRAAYPQGNKDEDNIALEFLEQAKHPYSLDGMIDVADLQPALVYFMGAPRNYLDQDDFDRVMRGWPI